MKKCRIILRFIGVILLTTPSALGFAATTAEEYFRQGCDYFEQEKFSQAVKAFEKAIELDPDNATYYYNLGAVYSNLGKYKEALRHFEKAVELKPEGQAGKLAKELITEIKNYLQETEPQKSEESKNPLQKQKNVNNANTDDLTRLSYEDLQKKWDALNVHYKLVNAQINLYRVRGGYDSDHLDLLEERINILKERTRILEELIRRISAK